MTLWNLNYTCFKSESRGIAEVDQKAHSATQAAIIVAGAQKRSPDYFDVKPDNFSVGEPMRNVTGMLRMVVA